MASWRWLPCVRPPKGTRDEPGSFHGHHLAKELRTEFRSRELLGTTVVFVLIVIVLFSFTFNPTSSESRRFGPGLLWLAFLFAGSLMLQPSFLREQTNDTLAALRLAPIDPFSILAGKMAANFLFLLLVELLLLPVFAVLYNIAIFPSSRRWFWSSRSARSAWRPRARYFPPSPRRPACANCSFRCYSCRSWRPS